MKPKTPTPVSLEGTETSFTYSEALAYLLRSARYDGRGRKYDDPERSLARVRQLLAALGNPQERFQAIHITGTKGKGSTSALSESILRTLGYRTGLFTSPHLHSFRERMRVDGQLADRTELACLIERLRPQFDAIPDLTVFDKITALAFQYFADKQVEWGIVEVGLGGRLDSTNVLLPAVCGITRVSRDHTHVLGNTLAKIAWEKAGIIKPGVPVFVAPQRPSVLEVLQQMADTRHADLTVVDPGQGMPTPLLGVHQQVNTAIALGMIGELVRQRRIRDDPVAVAAGVANTWWPGRFELLPMPREETSPLLVDCAHNVDSINILLNTLANYFPQRPLTFIFGANRDKPMVPMLRRLMSVSPRLVLVSSRHPKALPSTEILTELQPWLAQPIPSPTGTKASGRMASSTPVVKVADTMAEAIDTATAITPDDGLLVGTGSVFVVAELREAWEARYPGIFPATDWVHQVPGEPRLA